MLHLVVIASGAAAWRSSLTSPQLPASRLDCFVSLAMTH